MFAAVAFGTGGATCLAGGLWFAWRQRRRNASTLAGWGLLAVGIGQLIRATGSLTGDRQPLGVILALCVVAVSVPGNIMVALGRRTSRNGRGTRKRRKLPPIHP